MKSGLTQHLWEVHDVDELGERKLHPCPQENCTHVTKNKGSLTSHLQYVHDIGKYECQYCLQNHNSKILHADPTKKEKVAICRDCFKKATGLTSRVEKDWSDYLDKAVGVDYLLGSDKSLKALGGCQLYRPDKLYTGPDLVEVDECDEFQHTRTSGGYSCDEKRISDIYDEEGIMGKIMVVIRWNPDAYRLPEARKDEKKLLRKERLALHAKLKQRHRQLHKDGHLKDKIHVYYMFYNEDNERIARNIKYTLIYTEDDFPEAPLTNTNK